MKLFNWFNKNRISERVECDKEKIVRHMPDGETESIQWSKLKEIRIVTTNEGPWSEDAFWLFIGKDESEGCLIPNGADGFTNLFDIMESLPGYKDDIVIKAMGCTSNESFTVWKNEIT